MVQDSLLEFGEKINEILPVVIQGFTRRQANALYKGQITLPQLFILDLLNRQGESKMTDMAHFMQVTTAAMTGIVERLVRDGYVVRVYDPEDRRIIKIKLTGKGNALVKKINQQRLKMFIEIFGSISEVDRQDYLRILMQIRDVLARESSTAK
ncbi:MAG: MarR family transcriptional regulator [Candidatus Omnitrophota bacterium]|nr:MarR family transcriptional regulator [Candidatus Omnitrophota bacterium]